MTPEIPESKVFSTPKNSDFLPPRNEQLDEILSRPLPEVSRSPDDSKPFGATKEEVGIILEQIEAEEQEFKRVWSTPKSKVPQNPGNNASDDKIFGLTKKEISELAVTIEKEEKEHYDKYER
jgi:hypothetical protein